MAILKRRVEIIPSRVEARRPLPRVERGIHSPISTLSTASRHSRIPPEATYRDPNMASLACRIANNVQAALPQGSTPLSTRLAGALEAI